MAKEQFGHSYTFWTMAIMMFSRVSNLSHHPLCTFVWHFLNLGSPCFVSFLARGIGLRMKMHRKEIGMLFSKGFEPIERLFEFLLHVFEMKQQIRSWKIHNVLLQNSFYCIVEILFEFLLFAFKMNYVYWYLLSIR